MSVVSHRKNTCRLCLGTTLTNVLSLVPTPPANAFVSEEQLPTIQPTFPLDVFFCEDCHHVQLLDVVDPVVLFENYVYVSGTSPVFVKHFDEYAQYVIDTYSPKSGSLVFDIGSNDGTLLKAFSKAGYAVLGVDPALDIAAQASAEGIETIAGFFSPSMAENVRAEHGPASVITANNVFAHIDNLGSVLDGISSLLADDGVFMFEVSYLADVYQHTLFDTIYHEHLSYHTVGPLVPFMQAHGMELIGAERVNTHGGSLRAAVQKAGGGKPVSDTIGKMIEIENGMGMNQAECYRDFGAHIDDLKARLSTLLLDKKAEGRSIAAFGAPAKATTLMYHFGIGPNVIDFIVDDSPLKQGLYSPGLHIPVVSSSAIYDNKLDYLIILAWNFAPQIIEKHKAFQELGGQFIVPLPNITIH